MSRPPRISPAEQALLAALWDAPGQSASALHAALEADRGWSLTTVKTMLSRLADKGAVRAERDGRRFLYHPALSREDVAGREVRGLVRRLFGGRAAPLVASLADRDGLTDDDIAELEALIARMKRER